MSNDANVNRISMCGKTDSKETKTSAEWLKEFPHIIIIDHDGWDRNNFEYSFNEELVTKKEFETRLIRSTLNYANIFGAK